jgi:flagellin
MAERVDFNGKKLINGDYSAAGSMLYLQVGANSNQSIQFNIKGMDLSGLGLDTIASDVKLAASAGTWSDTPSAIDAMLDTFDTAISRVTDNRSKLGAIQNRLEYTMKSLDISSENLSASESRIRDADMASEMMRLSQTNVLNSAATSMLAQANQAPQSVLQLLQ